MSIDSDISGSNLPKSADISRPSNPVTQFETHYFSMISNGSNLNKLSVISN